MRVGFSLVGLTGLVLPPQHAPRHAPPVCQFKMPELPDFSDLLPKEESQPSPPPPAPAEKKSGSGNPFSSFLDSLDKPPPPKPKGSDGGNPFSKFMDAFTPVEVDREGNVVEPPPAPPPSYGDDPDVGEKLFGFFFGRPEEGEVAGLARTAGAPDTYPATKTEFAAPVAGDGTEEALLRPLLKNTNLEFLPLRKAYDAKRDGWTAAKWHAKVDKTGPCLVVAKTRGGALVGGYAPKGFAGFGEYRGSIAAFLFSWPDGNTNAPAIKLQKVGGAGLATIDEPETGPRFGSDGFVVSMNPGRERYATSKLGPYYEAMPGGVRSIFATSDDWKATELTELRTYVGVWPEGERIPFAGAIPFAIE